jgi:GH15 family glucan-1,4-alpha-glucosidase
VTAAVEAESAPAQAPATPIADYAVIGDCRSVALVSRTGSIDWLCWPRFDSPSLFGALLDPERGGRMVVRPTHAFQSFHRYIGRTNVLETTFRTETGVLRLVDFMPVASEDDKSRILWAGHQVVRLLECVEGEVEVEVRCDPRPDYGRVVPRLRDRGALGIYYEHRARALVLRSDLPLTLSADRSEAVGHQRLVRGERRAMSLVYADRGPAILPPLAAEAEVKLRATLAWWEAWAERCAYTGPFQDAVVRSALVLKLLAYAPSGAVVAAPTTSLPEYPGGVRNWDYRYCWLRDTSLTLQALFDLGYPGEAEAFIWWLRQATRLTSPEIQVLYDVYGESHVPERTLDHLAGYAGSRPVRIGNDAHNQLQLDIYGEVVDAAHQFAVRGGRLDRTTGRFLVGLGETVCRRWQEPDEGIWEVRGGRRHHTYSKAMCWVALDRLLDLHQARHLSAPVDRFRAVRDEIRQQIERSGYNAERGSYVSVFGGRDLDTSLLLLARYGYTPAQEPRMVSTWRAIERELARGPLFYRYRAEGDGLPAGEGAFGICSFWAVDYRARRDDLDGAHRAFEQLLRYASDTGLFAEEIDPDSGAALGNFPQAFTHVGLIDAALSLEHHAGRRTRPSAAQPVRLTGTRL